MKCEVCRQKNANVIFKTITDGQVATRAMCMDCAQNLQQDMYRVFLALGLRPDGQNQPERPQAAPAEQIASAVPRYLCAHCGRPFDSLDEHTMAGCAHCYNAMEQGLSAVLTGEKAPLEAPQTQSQADSQTELKYQLLEAVMKEDFEKAAHLRDKIQALGSAEAAEEEP
jgi:protein arginine kinase activator